MKYNKLVRDRIPEIIENKGLVAVTHVAADEEYGRKLQEKLQEELDEILSNPSPEEIADLLEVIDALCKFYDYDLDAVERIRLDKARSRGTFEERIILEETKES